MGSRYKLLMSWFLFSPRERKANQVILVPLVLLDPEEKWDTQAFLERREEMATKETLGPRVTLGLQEDLEKL